MNGNQSHPGQETPSCPDAGEDTSPLPHTHTSSERFPGNRVLEAQLQQIEAEISTVTAKYQYELTVSELAIEWETIFPDSEGQAHGKDPVVIGGMKLGSSNLHACS